MVWASIAPSTWAATSCSSIRSRAITQRDRVCHCWAHSPARYQVSTISARPSQPWVRCPWCTSNPLASVRAKALIHRLPADRASRSVVANASVRRRRRHGWRNLRRPTTRRDRSGCPCDCRLGETGRLGGAGPRRSARANWTRRMPCNRRAPAANPSRDASASSIRRAPSIRPGSISPVAYSTLASTRSTRPDGSVPNAISATRAAPASDNARSNSPRTHAP